MLVLSREGTMAEIAAPPRRCPGRWLPPPRARPEPGAWPIPAASTSCETPAGKGRRILTPRREGGKGVSLVRTDRCRGTRKVIVGGFALAKPISHLHTYEQ